MYLKLQENAREVGLNEEAVADIQAKIDKLNKQVEKEPPPGHLMESTRLFLERASKWLAKAEEELVEMLEAVAQSAAMQVYLNNRSSRGGAANENYARELFELHTLGRPAYLNALYN